MHLELRTFWKKACILTAIGVAISVYMAVGPVNMLSSGILTNSFFIIANVFLVAGLFALVGNLGVFNSMRYGFKCIRRVVTKQHDSAGSIKDGYIEYCKSRPKKQDAPITFVFAAVFFVVSVILAFVGV